MLAELTQGRSRNLLHLLVNMFQSMFILQRQVRTSDSVWHYSLISAFPAGCPRIFHTNTISFFFILSALLPHIVGVYNICQQINHLMRTYSSMSLASVQNSMLKHCKFVSLLFSVSHIEFWHNHSALQMFC